MVAVGNFFCVHGLEPPTQLEADPLSPSELLVSWCPSVDDEYYSPPAKCSSLKSSVSTTTNVSAFSDALPRHPTVMYTVIYKEVNDSAIHKAEVAGLLTVLRDLLPNTAYEVYVVASAYDGTISESDHVTNSTGDYLLKDITHLRAHENEDDMFLTWEWGEATDIFAAARFKVSWDGSISETHHRYYTIEDYPISEDFTVCVNAIMDGDWSKASCVDYFYVPPSTLGLALILGVGLPGVLVLVTTITFIVMLIQGKFKPMRRKPKV